MQGIFDVCPCITWRGIAKLPFFSIILYIYVFLSFSYKKNFAHWSLSYLSPTDGLWSGRWYCDDICCCRWCDRRRALEQNYYYLGSCKSLCRRSIYVYQCLPRRSEWKNLTKDASLYRTLDARSVCDRRFYSDGAICFWYRELFSVMCYDGYSVFWYRTSKMICFSDDTSFFCFSDTCARHCRCAYRIRRRSMALGSLVFSWFLHALLYFISRWNTSLRYMDAGRIFSCPYVDTHRIFLALESTPCIYHK